MQELDLNPLAGSAKLANVVVKMHAKATLSASSIKVKNCTLNIFAELTAGFAMIKQLHIMEKERVITSHDVSGNDDLIVKSNAGSIKIKYKKPCFDFKSKQGFLYASFYTQYYTFLILSIS